MINYILFSCLALFWGGSFVAIKFLIHEVPSFSAAFYRVFFSVIFLTILFNKKLKFPKKLLGREFLLICATGLCSVGVPFSLLFWGETFISPSIAGVLNGTVPFWTLIIAVIFFNEAKSVTPKKIAGLIVGFIGLALIFGPKIKIAGESQEIFGLLALSGMSFFYAIGINLNKKILEGEQRISKKLNLWIQQITSVLYLGIIVLFVDGVPKFSLLLEPKIAGAVFYISFISTTLAFIIFYKLINEWGSVKASTVTFFVPPVSLVLDSLIYQRQLSTLEIAGTITILASMVLLRQGKVKI